MNILLLTESEYLFKYQLTALKEIIKFKNDVSFKLLISQTKEKRTKQQNKLIKSIDKRFSNYPQSPFHKTHYSELRIEISLVTKLPESPETDAIILFNGVNSQTVVSKELKKFNILSFHYSEKTVFRNALRGDNSTVLIISKFKESESWKVIFKLEINAEKGIYNSQSKYLFYSGLYLGRMISKLDPTTGKDLYFELWENNFVSTFLKFYRYSTYLVTIIKRRISSHALNWRIKLFFHDSPIEFNQPRKTFWADPFLFKKDNELYVFFEELVNQKGEISVIKFDKKLKYISKECALVEDFHLSFPNVFEKNGEIFMMPESSAGNNLSIYQNVSFPTKWKKKSEIFTDKKLVDAVWIYHENLYWIFANVINEFEVDNNEQMHIFYSTDLFSSDWNSHISNPVITSVEKSRNAGLIRNENGKIIRVSQNCKNQYGGFLIFNEIEVLTTVEYKERILRVEYPPQGYYGKHTYNSIGEISAVDVLKKELII